MRILSRALLGTARQKRIITSILQGTSCTTCTRLQSHSRSNSDWSSKKIRKTYIDFFRDQHKHDYYPASSVVPPKGSGTFFTNAGMNQFKSIFLGTVSPDSPLHHLTRAVNSQKCIRLSGKHNDLSDVGHDTTHHTFFEMLGNWSFGDYFKREAISMAWELLTKVYMIPEDRLYVTYFAGDESLSLKPDHESRDIWLELGLPKKRILPGSSKDNFWEMGDTGPCGPCSEIHYDFVGGRDACALVNADHPDVVELWNLVFIQYNRLSVGELELLPNTHVDTGMGLERLVSVLQNKRSNYDTDLFSPILSTINKSSLCGPYTGRLTSQSDIAYRIVADHARMMCVSIADGIIPANIGLDGLCAKLRQIMLRLFRYQRKCLLSPPMTANLLVDPVIDTLGETFPELNHQQQQIQNIILNEEERYYEVVSDYYSMLNDFLGRYPFVTEFTVEDLHRLKDLNPDLDLSSLELLSDVAMDFHKVINPDLQLSEDTSIEEAMLPTPPVRKSTTSNSRLLSQLQKADIPATNDEFKYQVQLGGGGSYDWSGCDGRVLAILRDGMMTDTTKQVADNKTFQLVSDKTCFYAEQGGQAADTGSITSESSTLSVLDVQYEGQHVIHTCRVDSGSLHVGDVISMSIDQDRRSACALNHTATHLLNHSLRSSDKFSDAQQAGSSVGPDDLTFSFSCKNTVTLSDLQQISHHINTAVDSQTPLCTVNLSFSDVKHHSGITRLATHQYPSTVRVVGVGPVDKSLYEGGKIDYSAELCGGTHVMNTGDIQKFVIVGLVGQSQPVKKLTALTGTKAIESERLMTSLIEQADSLISDVRRDNNPESWQQRLKAILQTHGQHKDILPKVERESMIERLTKERIAEKIKARQTQATSRDLQAEVEKLLNETDQRGVTSQLSFRTYRDICKVLRRLSPEIPVCLYNDAEKPILVFYSPTEQSNEWASNLETDLGIKLQPAKGKNMTNMYTAKLSQPVSPEQDSTIRRCISVISKEQEVLS